MAVEYKDYYKLLGISRNAGKDEISKAFKRLARKYHPDLNPGSKEAENKFKDINEAYEVLKDDEKRRLYDRLGPNWQHGQNFQRPPGFDGFHNPGGGSYAFTPGGAGGGFDRSSFSDFFETLFGGSGFTGGGQGQNFGPDPFGNFSRKSKRGRDIEADLRLTMEEACHGGPKAVSVNTAQGQKTLEVTIPAGVKEGARIRLAGQGDPGFGGQSGDLYLRVSLLPHRHFKLEQNDICYDLPLAPWEAALGVKVRVPTLDGDVEIAIPPASGSGKKLRLRGRGLGSDADKGDEYIRLAIKMPENINDEARKLWEELAKVSDFKARG